ncbi:hypothetical protein MG290_03205 [Flavobacterium sp. CBA20B-1]|uniref:hypothetical protein n=1 Tax=unclassified Flavobacterium TaxID=196869 RepID=UPI002223F2BF|nr:MULTISPECIES: hypothetical protein [unclassified Flavobacterium]WCM42701.1 hypothetical protein MG290_03205 [Flavobacterium sp. CBA20B-1]
MATGKKTGGRVKGTPNRITTETKNIIQNIVSNELQNLPKMLNELKPHERIEIMIKLLVYVLPKQNQLGFGENTEQKTITIIDLGSGETEPED